MAFIKRMDQLEERLHRLEEEMAQLRRQKRVVSPKPKVETKARQRARFTLVANSKPEQAVQALFKKRGVESDPQNTEWGVVVEYSTSPRPLGDRNRIREELAKTKRSIYITIYPSFGMTSPKPISEEEMGVPTVALQTDGTLANIKNEDKAWKDIVAAFKRTQK